MIRPCKCAPAPQWVISVQGCGMDLRQARAMWKVHAHCQEIILAETAHMYLKQDSLCHGNHGVWAAKHSIEAELYAP